jgi:hypothetical protein
MANDLSEFRVVCDETNNTPETVAQGLLVADIYVPRYMIKLEFTVDKDGKVTFQ